MAFRVAIFLLILGSSNLFGQHKDWLLGLDRKTFEDRIKESPELVTRDLWSFFDGRASLYFRQEKYCEAYQSSEKATILAENVKEKQLLYKSYKQLEKISVLLREYSKASDYHDRARKNYRREFASSFPKVANPSPEYAYFLYYRALGLCDPRYKYSESNIALRFLGIANGVSDLSDSEYDEVSILTSLQIAKCFGLHGYNLAKILWLEKARSRLSDSVKRKKEILFDISYESYRAYKIIGDYSQASKELEKMKTLLSQVSAYSKISYYRASFDFNQIVNRTIIADRFQNKIRLSITYVNNCQSVRSLKDWGANLLRSRVLMTERSEKKILKIFKKLYRQRVYFLRNQIELNVLNGVIAGLSGSYKRSDEYFSRAEKLINRNGENIHDEILLRIWQSKVLLYRENYEKLKLINEKYLDLGLRTSNLDILISAYGNLSKAHYKLGNIREARKANLKAIDIIEEQRRSAFAYISTGILNQQIEAYQLKISLDLMGGKTDDAFLTSETAKGRWLNDRITGNLLRRKVSIAPELKTGILDTTLGVLADPENKKLFLQLSRFEEKTVLFENHGTVFESLTNVDGNLIRRLNSSGINDQTTVVSYAFTNERKLLAFVWKKGEGIKLKHLRLTEDEVDEIAKSVQNKIKGFVFFKQEGKFIYDKLIRPLDLKTKHLTIIPDKSLWKIPFHALSEDGRTYLIENISISYASSLSIILQQLNNPKPNRQTFQVFSNASFKGDDLKFADSEALGLAKIYNVKPNLNASASSFKKRSDKSDILHFSMHAAVDKVEPFRSYLGFKPVGIEDGKLTVDDLLEMKTKKGSLVFLASCDTTNVFNGEGIVSLAWGMMAAGSSTVIATQWEANDESTGRFTKLFYKYYKQGNSGAEAIQIASKQMIKDRTGKMSAPYYWAGFSLMGDYR